MAEKSKAPELQSEAAEANWWPEQEDKIASSFEKAAAEGTLGHSTLARRSGAIPPTTIRLDRSDIERAREQAQRRGLKYQTYLKMLIHEALQQEALQHEEKHRAG